LCCATYGADKIVAEDFLSTDNAALIDARYAHDYCGTCMGRRLYYVYTGAYPPALVEEAVRVLGDDYDEYLKATRVVGNPKNSAFENTFRTIQEVYDLGIAALSTDEVECA